MDRAIAGLIVVGFIAVYVAGMLLLDWIVERMTGLAVRLHRRCRAARASR
jgi:hypothetical protein